MIGLLLICFFILLFFRPLSRWELAFCAVLLALSIYVSSHADPIQVFEDDRFAYDQAIMTGDVADVIVQDNTVFPTLDHFTALHVLVFQGMAGDLDVTIDDLKLHFKQVEIMSLGLVGHFHSVKFEGDPGLGILVEHPFGDNRQVVPNIASGLTVALGVLLIVWASRTAGAPRAGTSHSSKGRS